MAPLKLGKEHDDKMKQKFIVKSSYTNSSAISHRGCGMSELRIKASIGCKNTL